MSYIQAIELGNISRKISEQVFKDPGFEHLVDHYRDYNKEDFFMALVHAVSGAVSTSMTEVLAYLMSEDEFNELILAIKDLSNIGKGETNA
jgi:hypothetical protein